MNNYTVQSTSIRMSFFAIFPYSYTLTIWGYMYYQYFDNKKHLLGKVIMPHYSLSRHKLFVLLIFISCLSLSDIVFAETSDFKEALLQKAKDYQNNGELYIGARRIYATQFITGIYDLNGRKPLWNKSNRQGLLAIFDSMYEEGLVIDDYHFPEIDGYLDQESKKRLSASDHLDLDILLTEGLVRVLYNLAFGKVDPVALDPNINFTRQLADTDFASLLLKHIQAGSIDSLVNVARPKDFRYESLKTALAKYRQIKRTSGWNVLPQGKILKIGDQDDSVLLLRARLQLSGDYQENHGEARNKEFNEPIKASVELFQQRHGLEVDGAIGPKTLAAMNVSVEKRIEQIRINLERQRWYLHQIEGEFIFVDIAGFKAYWLKDGEIIWDQLVQVGNYYTSTPVFQDQIEYLEFNPTWTIPPGIIRRSILPNLKKDSGYLKKQGFLLLTLDGKPLDAEQIDWSAMKNFPYMVRQPAGPTNALGLVKFIFPNPHYVFLHDTNHRELFSRTSRTFSAGCIRVHEPFDFAEKLLQGHKGNWTREKIDALVASGKTKRVHLDTPMKIIIGYSTAFAADGQVHFKDDIYKRDAKVLKALNGRFTIRKQDRTN